MPVLGLDDNPIDIPINQLEEISGGKAFALEFSEGVHRGFLNVGGGLIGTAEWLIPGKQESMLGWKENIQSAAEKYDPKYSGIAAKGGRILGEAFPYMATALIGGGAAGGAAKAAGASAKGIRIAQGLGAATVGFSVEGQTAYDDAIASGATERQANNERLIVGTINAAIEASQIGRVLKFGKSGGVPLKSFVRNVRARLWADAAGDISKFTGMALRNALEEGLEEAAQEGVSISVPGLLRGEMPRREDGSVDWGQVMERIGYAGIGGAFAGSVLGTAGSMVYAAPEVGRPSEEAVAEAKDRINKMNLDPKEKEFWNTQFDEYLTEDQNQRLDQALVGVEIPQNAIEVYRGKETGEVYFETADQTETQIVEDEAGNMTLVSTKTQEPLELDEKSTKALDTVKGDLPALKRVWDTDLVSSVKEVDSLLRSEHKATIKEEKGRRAEVAKAILKDETIGDFQQRWRMAKGAMKGSLGLRFDPIQMDENKVAYYYQRASVSGGDLFTKMAAVEGLDSLFGLYKDSEGRAKLPEPNQIKAMGKIFGADLENALMDLTDKQGKATRKVLETLNFPRAVLASFDFSAAGRQGLMLLPTSPKAWFKGLWSGYRAWLSPEYAKFVDTQMRSDPYWQGAQENGLHISEPGHLQKGEEVYMSKYAKLIPGIEASERAYTTTLNTLRFYTYKKYAQKWIGSGKSKADYQKLAKFINHATGRGDLKSLEEFAPFLNAAFFAPRLQMGRIQSITDLFKGVGQDIKDVRAAKGLKAKYEAINPVRKIIAADLAAFFGGGLGILFLLSLRKGVKVEKDPRSSDFGKIRIGNTRVDFWAGYSQMARLLARMTTGEVKSTESGRVFGTNRGDVLWRFLQTKLSPAAGLSVDLMRGETFLGEPLELTGESVGAQAYQRFTPLFFQDVRDAMVHQGLLGVSIVAPLASHGIGAMTYPRTASSEASRIRDVHAMDVYGRAWDKLSFESQKLLKEARPEIGIAEKKSKIDRRNFKNVATALADQRKATSKVISKLPRNIRNEFKELDVYIPGLSRQVGGGWYLNDARYKEYQERFAAALKRHLPEVMGGSFWDTLLPEMKASYVEEMVSELRRYELQQLMAEATIDDLQKEEE